MEGIVIDTNVFVAAGFNPRSASARVLAGVQDERFHLIWNQPTRREIEMILRRIRRLDWEEVANLFQPEGEFTGPVDPSAFVLVRDRDDRKFAALSAAAKRPLVTNDNFLLTDLSIIEDRRAHAARLPGTSGRPASRSRRRDRERAGNPAHKSPRTTKLYDRTGDEIRSIRSSGSPI
jgi:predicted nucleic acid-binding protein